MNADTDAPRARTAWVVLLLVAVLTAGLPAAATAQEDATTDAADPEVEDARRQLRSNGLEPGVLALHAKTLLDAGDLYALREILAGDSEAPILGILLACQATREQELLPELVALAAQAPTARIDETATRTLEHLAADRPDVLRVLVDDLSAARQPDEQLAVIVSVLGRSRNLDAVEPLIAELDGPRGDLADEALCSLTGQRTRPFADDAERVTWWNAFWDEHASLPRDVLFEQVLVTERQDADEALARMQAEVIQSRIELMGQGVDRLSTALTDDYAAVRLEAARRLGQHSDPTRAASAIPEMLERLGYGATVANGGAVAAERDAQVRAAIITALGTLGRDKPAVRAVLLEELQGGGAQAKAAVAALSRVRGEPDVVRPLIAYLQRDAPDQDTVVTVLDIVAANRPSGVLDDLVAWLGPAHGASVRAAAVGAVLASRETMDALDRVEALATSDEDREVRYALAVAAGTRVRQLERDDGARPRFLELLSELIDDRDKSVRAEAAASLGATSESGALAILERRSQVETETGVVLGILDALGELAFLDAIAVIGRLCCAAEGEERVTLEQAAKRALTDIGGERGAGDWLDMARTLQEVSAYTLAETCLREIENRPDDSSDGSDVKERARGQLAVVLWLGGKTDAAWDLATRLHVDSAPYPETSVLLDLLARTSNELGFHDDAANYFLERLELLPAGDSTRSETQRAAANALLLADRDEEALPLVQELLAADPSDNELLWWLAQIQMALAQDAEARVTLERLLDRIPAEDELFHDEVSAALQMLAPATGEGVVRDGSSGEDDGDS